MTSLLGASFLGNLPESIPLTEVQSCSSSFWSQVLVLRKWDAGLFPLRTVVPWPTPAPESGRLPASSPNWRQPDRPSNSSDLFPNASHLVLPEIIFWGTLSTEVFWNVLQVNQWIPWECMSKNASQDRPVDALLDGVLFAHLLPMAQHGFLLGNKTSPPPPFAVIAQRTFTYWERNESQDVFEFNCLRVFLTFWSGTSVFV